MTAGRTRSGADHIAIVGTGPTGLYTLQHLIERASDCGARPAITLFERAETAGVGMPYSPETASRAMLANIASIEIPPLMRPYLDWLEEQPAPLLRDHGLDPDDLDDRQFTPRLLLGRYFRDQFLGLRDRARAAGLTVTVHEATEVTDIRPASGGLTLNTHAGSFGPFGHVILATGHDFPDEDSATQSYFPSPWSGLIDADIPAARIGILGTSLSGIDAAMAVAGQHGRFRRHAGDLTFSGAPDSLRITLMSRSGILPEADFWCPIPWLPLSIMTEQAIADCSSDPKPLDAAFDLLRRELDAEDPAYAHRIGLATLTADSFADAYFAAREDADPFRWARHNLDEVERNKAAQVTVPWRYALLRMHEQMERLVPDLSEDDRARFDAGLKHVFVDNYAAIPSESIRRLLALRDAGVLSIRALGDDYDQTRDGACTVIATATDRHVFDVFIDARGQKPLESKDIPFPSLRRALLDAGQDSPNVDGDFRLAGVSGYGALTMAALPWLMRDRPFVQGITASDEIGSIIARAVTAPAYGSGAG